MASDVMLSAVPRGRVGSGALSAHQLRRSGYLPAVLYGHGVDNLLLAIDAKAFAKALHGVSSSTLLSLSVSEGDVRRVLVQGVQHHPLTGEPTHVDFHQVKLTEKIHAKVPLRAVGVAPAVKDRGGVLIQSMVELDVEALPQDLPGEIAVDLTRLETFEDRLTVADLPIPQGVELHEKPEAVVALVAPPRTEAELKTELEAPTAAAPTEVKTESESKKAAEEAKKAIEGEPVVGKKAEEKKEDKKK